MAKRNQTHNVNAPATGETDLRTAAIDAALILSMGEGAISKIKSDADKASAVLSHYFSDLLKKYADAKVLPTKDTRKTADVPDFDNHVLADEAAMLGRVNAMSADEMTAYGWERETYKSGKELRQRIKGYSIPRTWAQYKTNCRTAIINGQAKVLVDRKTGGSDPHGNVPMSSVMKLNRDATRTSKIEQAQKQHDAIGLALMLASGEDGIIARMRTAAEPAEKEGEKQAAQRCQNMIAIALCKLGETVNEALKIRGMTPVKIEALQALVNSKQMPVIESKKPTSRRSKPEVKAA